MMTLALALFLVTMAWAQDQKHRLSVDGDDFGEIEKINFYTKGIPLTVIGTQERFITYELISEGKHTYEVSDLFSVSKKYNLLSFTEKAVEVKGINLKVTMPEHLVLEFTNQSAQLTLKGLKTRYLEIASEDGMVGLVDIVSEGIDISCDSCTLNMESIAATISSVNKHGNTMIDVESLKLFNNFEHPIIASSDTGDITLNLPKEITTTVKTRAKHIQVDDELSAGLKQEGKYTYVRIKGGKDYGKNSTHPTRNMVILSSNQGEVRILKR